VEGCQVVLQQDVQHARHIYYWLADHQCPQLQVPFGSQTMPKLLIVCGLSGLCVYLNSFFNTPPVTASQEFQAEAARFGVVMVSC
jgi:hypothetical protein